MAHEVGVSAGDHEASTRGSGRIEEDVEVSVEQVSVETSVHSTAVTLSFPAVAEHIRLARLVASGLVAPLDYGLDDVEDLRIAVDELCALIVAHAEPSSMLTLTFEVADGEVRVRAAAPAPPPDGPGSTEDREVEVDELSRLILLAAADDHDVSRRDGEIVGHLRKRPAGADG